LFFFIGLYVGYCMCSRQRAFRVRPALFHCQSNSLLPISNHGSEPDIYTVDIVMVIITYKGTTVFPLIEVGSQIQAGSLMGSRGLTANTIGLMVLVIGSWCVASFVTYYSRYWYLIMASDVQKSEKSQFKIKVRSR